MTGMLARLVARANGTEPTGLRPRLPARFETVTAPDPAERTSFRTQEPADDPAPRDWTAPEASTPQRPAAMKERPVRGRIPTGAMDRASPDTPSRPGAPSDLREPFNVSETHAVEATPHPVGSTSDTASAVNPGSRPTGSMDAPAEPERQSTTVPQPRASEPPELRSHPPSPPEPLMPIAPQPSLPPSEAAITGPRPFREPEAGNRAASAVPEPPEIVIHIGRIDLTAVPEPAVKPRQRPARPPSTDLSDYLRRDGGAR